MCVYEQRVTIDARALKNRRLTEEEARLLFKDCLYKGVNMTKGLHKTEVRSVQAEAERRESNALLDTCLAEGSKIKDLEERATPLHKVAGSIVEGVPGVIVAMQRGLATWHVLQHVHNTSKVRQQRRRLQMRKHNLEQRIARMLTVMLPKMLADVELEFVEAVRAKLVARGVNPADASDDQMSAAMLEAIEDGKHLTRTVHMVARSPASRKAEQKGSLRQQWDDPNRQPGMCRPQLSEEEKAAMRRHTDITSKTKIFVSERARAYIHARALTTARARSFTMTGTQRQQDSATHRPTPAGRLSANCARE